MALSQSFSEMRQRNGDDIVRLIKLNPGVSRAQLAKESGLAKATISVIVEELLGKQLLQETGSHTSSGGRPAVGLALNANYGYILGISIDFSEISACILDLEGSIKYEWQIQIAQDWQAQQLIEIFLLELDCVLTSIGMATAKLLYTGIAVVGPIIDMPDKGVKHDWEESQRFIRLYKKQTRAHLIIETNANMSAVAEIKNLNILEPGMILVVRIGHRIRSALLIGGKLLTDSNGFGGEFGHMKIRNSRAICHCGVAGCLNTIASTEAILARANQLGVRARNIKEIVAAIKHGNDGLIEVFNEAGEAIGDALANCINLLAPQAVVISGRGSDARSLLMEPILKRVEQLALPGNRNQCKILLGSMRNNSESYGVALSAAQKLRPCPI